MDYEKFHKDTIAKLQEMVNSGKITVEVARGICADFIPESEDERIKRVIKQVLYESTTEKDECYLDNGVTQQEVFAWLEKQGEQPKKHDVCDNCDQQGSCVSPCPMKLVEKHGEQKLELKFDIPKIKIKDDVSITSRVIHISETLKPIADFVIDYSHWNLHKDEWNHPVPEVPLFRVLDALVQKGKPYQGACCCVEQKPAWSEEDERICQCLIQDHEEALDKVSNDKYGHSEIISDLEEMYRERIAFLKSIKDRVQPKQKWSEDSEKMIESCIFCFEKDMERAKSKFCESDILPDIIDGYKKKIDWLKSLKPQTSLEA